PDAFSKNGLVAREGAWIRHLAKTTCTPVLGICCGHQILAGAFGGEVGKRDEKNDRVLPVYPIAENPLFSKPLNLQFHHAYEVKKVPDGFEWFAEGKPPASAIQGIRLKGKSVFGIQAHPELGADGLEIITRFLELI
ncbi:MAG TPA: hypothetical protein VI874_00870, partial [Candidatus Norongarragalinales archaeon]|nr:hypothetical protein [Candidatus Norongarragalinales archaeon]